MSKSEEEIFVKELVRKLEEWVPELKKTLAQLEDAKRIRPETLSKAFTI